MQPGDPVLNLRPEGGQDSEFLARLYRSTREDLLLLNLPEAMLQGLLDMQLRAQQAAYRSQFPDARHQILELAGEPIGGLLAHRGDEAIRLVYLALLPHARNRGYGRRLIEALQAEAADADKPLTLSVFTLNTPAQRLYASTGFRPAGNDGINVEMIWEGKSISPNANRRNGSHFDRQRAGDTMPPGGAKTDTGGGIGHE